MGYSIDGQDFAAYKPVSNIGNRPTAGLSAYPHVVKIVGDTQVGGRCQADLRDIRFALALDPLTALYAERNHGAIAGGAATGAFWVNVPSVLSSADMELLMYYGSPTAPAQANPEMTWHSDWRGVLHLQESGFNYLDSTANARHGTVGTAPTAVAGLIGNSQSTVQASSQYIRTPQLLPTWGSAFSISGWFKGTLAHYYVPMDCRASNGVGALIYTLNTNGRAQFYTNGPGHGIGGTVDLRDGVWHHIVGTYDGTSKRLYVDGALVAGPAVVGLLGSLPAYTTICASYDGGYSTATYDEARSAAGVRSAAAIAYDYGTQNAADGWLTWGAEVAAPSGGARIVVPTGSVVLGRDLSRGGIS